MNEFKMMTSAPAVVENKPTIYCEQHSFFSSYAETLQDVLAVSDWTSVLELSNVLFVAREKGKKFLFVATAVALQMLIIWLTILSMQLRDLLEQA